MVTTLRYLDEVLGGFPDNTQGLITAEKERDFVISTTTGIGLMVDSTEFTVPITDGVPTVINPLLTAPQSTTQLWTYDGNNLAVSNYSSVPGLTVPSPHFKLIALLAILSLEKVAGGSDDYSTQFTKNGVGIGLDEFLTFPAAGAQVVTVITFDIADISQPDTYGVQITGQGTSDDLQLHTFEMRIDDTILLSAP